MNKSNITPDIVRAAETLFTAMAWVQTVKPIVRGYQTAILERHQWKGSKEMGADNEIILTPERSYMLPDESFQRYLAECRVEQVKAGLKTDSPEHCPLLVAEYLQTQAEWTLCDLMEPLTGISYDMLMMQRGAIDKRQQYIDLTLAMLAPMVREQECRTLESKGTKS